MRMAILLLSAAAVSATAAPALAKGNYGARPMRVPLGFQSQGKVTIEPISSNYSPTYTVVETEGDIREKSK